MITKISLITDKKEKEEEEKLGLFGGWGLSDLIKKKKEKEEEKPFKIVKIKPITTPIKTQLGIGAKAMGGATLSKPDGIPGFEKVEDTKLSAYKEPEKNIIDKLKQSVLGIFKEKPEIQIAKAQVSYNISNETGIPLPEVEENLDKYSKALGVRSIPTNEEFLSAMFVFPVTAAIISNPISAGIGISKFLALTEAENLIISKSKGWEYKFGAGMGLKDLTPEDTNQITKDILDVVDFAAKGVIIGATDKGTKAMWNKFTKDVITKYSPSQKVYLSSEKIKDLHLHDPKLATQFEKDVWRDFGDKAGAVKTAFQKGGVDIETPATIITKIADKPYWAKIKGLFNIKPTAKTVISNIKGKWTVHTAGLLPEPATELGAGVTPKQIANSIIKVGKVSAEVVKGLDPVKVSQVTGLLPPALASEFLKAVEKPEVGEIPLDIEENELIDMDNKPVELNEDGTITLYHRTTPENAEKIKSTGNFVSKENRNETFFSTKLEGQSVGYGEGVVTVRVKPSDVRLDDAFHGGDISVAVSNKILSKQSIAEKPEAIKEEPKPYTATVYRGTKEGEAPTDEGLFGKGTYYTTNKEYAGTYGEVKETKIELKNPFVIENQKEADDFWNEVTRPARKKAINEGKTPQEANEIAAVAAREYLETKGYDGLIAKNIIEKGDEVVVFEPEKAEVKPTIPKALEPLAEEAISEQDIKEYIDKNKKAEIINIDWDNEEIKYKQGKNEITGFFSNIKEWKENLTNIGKEKYQIADWWKEKNNIEWNLLQEGNLEVKTETNKAILLTNNVGTDVWIPKSVIEKIQLATAKPTEKKAVVGEAPKPEVKREVEVKPEPTKEDFEALKTTDKNKELFYEKYNQVYTETKKGYDRLIDEKVAELKEEGFKGIDKGGLKRDEEGYVIGAYPTTSNNPKWYRDFYAREGKAPSNRDLREIAIEQLSKGYTEDYGEISANKIFTTLNTQLETLDIVLSDIKEGSYSFEISGNVLKLNKELDRLKKEIGKTKKEYEAKIEKQITESQEKFKQLSKELNKQKKRSTKEDIKKIKGLEAEKIKTEKNIEKLKENLKEAKSKISKPKPKKVKAQVREITGQIPDKIEIAERDILRLVLRGEAKGARKAFAEGKKVGIFGQKEHFTEVVARAKERKFKTEEIGKVKKILENIDLKKLRPERQKVIKSIIDDIDLKRMTEKTKRKLTSRLDYIKENPDNKIPQEKISELERLNKKPISDFTAGDITLIKNAILHEINLNKLKNKYIFGKQIKEASEVLKTARSNVLKGKDIKKDDPTVIDSSITEHETLWHRVKRIWKSDSWNPEVICEELDSVDHGEIMGYVYNGIDKGVSDKIRIDQETDDWFTDKLKDIKIDNWSKAFQPKKKNIDFQKIKLSGYKLPDGKTVGDRTINITKGERISFLLHEKNEKNLNHLLEGGFRLADNLTKKHYLSEDNLNEIISSATKDEVKVANIMWEFFNEKMKPKLNEASMELNGWEVATEDNYFPIRTVQLDRKRDMLKARKTFADKTLEGMGIFKERTNAKNALIIEDVFNVVTKHLEQTSSYIGLAKPLRYAKLLLEDTKLQENIRQVYGKEYIENLKDYLQRIEDDSTNVDNFDKLTIEAINKLDTAILGAHIFISFKQPVSYLIANTEIDTKYLSKALFTKQTYAEIKEHSPQLKQRLDGQINREMGELGNVGRTRQLFLNKSPLSNKLLYMIRATDTITIGKIWNAVKLEIKDKYPDLKGDEYWEKVTERAEEVIRRTQPTWHIKDRSKIGRSRSVWVRLLTKYTSQRNKNVNALKRAQLKYNRSGKKAKDKISYLKKVTTVLVTSALMIEAINELRRRAYGTKSKSVWEFAINTIGTAIGNFYFVGDIFNSLKSKIQKGTYAGYDTGNIVSSYMDNAINGLAELGRTLDQLESRERYKSGSRKGELKWKSTALRALDRNASSLLAFKGLPYDNLKRLLAGMWKMASGKPEKKPEAITIGKPSISKITIPKISKIKINKISPIKSKF